MTRIPAQTHRFRLLFFKSFAGDKEVWVGVAMEKSLIVQGDTILDASSNLRVQIACQGLLDIEYGNLPWVNCDYGDNLADMKADFDHMFEFGEIVPVPDKKRIETWRIISEEEEFPELKIEVVEQRIYNGK